MKGFKSLGMVLENPSDIFFDKRIVALQVYGPNLTSLYGKPLYLTTSKI